jgi:DNA (cytosine-5)-methyltransferase 1
VAALTSNGVGTCGPDDNQAQAGHLIPFVKAKRAATDVDDESWNEGGVSPTLNAMDNAGESRATVLAILGEVTHALTSEGADASEDGTGRGTPIVSFPWQAAGSWTQAEWTEGPSPTLPKSQTLAVHDPGVAVRRLTPRECERLQGFPDDWTLHRLDPTKGVVKQADAPRYKQMGNAVAVPVVEWILARIIEVENTP